MQILEANKLALQQYRTELWEAIADSMNGIESECSYQLEQAKDGNAIDVLTVEGKPVYLQSQYRPIEEAKRFVKQYADAKKSSCFLMLGMGNGYIVREFMQKTDISLVFYEPSSAYFLHVLKYYDISDIIAAKHVHLYVEGINDSNLKWDMFVYVHRLNWHLFYMDALPKYSQLYPAAKDYLTVLYEESQTHGMQNYAAVNSKADVEFHNFLANMEYYRECSCLHEYEGVLSEEIPVIIVAGGPSLEKNMEQLKEYRNRAFIIAVDRVAPILAEREILPHAYVTVDAEKELVLFDDVEMQKVPWFAYTTSVYSGLARVREQGIIFASTICKYADYLFDKMGTKLGELINGGSVATVATVIAMKLGSKRIILIGQDLALTGDKLHAGESTGAVDANQDSVIPVKGYYGETVLSREDFKVYLDWYTAFALQYQDIHFVNATEGGAYIEGMQHISLKEAMEQYGLDGFDGDAIMAQNSLFMTEQRQAILLQELEDLLSYFGKVQRVVGDAIVAMKEGITILKRDGFQNPKLVKVEQHMNGFQELYNGHAGHYILDVLLGKEIQDALLDLSFTSDDLNVELERLYTKMLTYFEGIERAVQEAKPALREVLEKLKIKE